MLVSKTNIISKTLKKKKLIIDERIRNIELEYLSKYFEVIKLPLSEDVYDEISGHSDIFYCNLEDKIICAPNAKIIEPSFIIGKNKVKYKYPEDVYYNACKIGDKIIGSKYTDSSISVDILTIQGYTKCSIAVTGENSCITTDVLIAKELKKNHIDALLIDERNIKLLDTNKNISKRRGFIGGASLVFDNKFVLFGDIEKLYSKNIILSHLKKYNLQLVDFKELEVYDYGGGIIYTY